LYDIAADEAALIPITLASDLDQLREKWVEDPMQYVTSAHIHPEGESVVLTARGRVFVAPAKRGRFVRASRKDGVRFRNVLFMPDGKTLLGLSDETGEFEFTRIPANGVGEDEALTSNGSVLRYQLRESRGHRRFGVGSRQPVAVVRYDCNEQLPPDKAVQCRDGYEGTAHE
jgi:tricorn protease